MTQALNEGPGFFKLEEGVQIIVPKNPAIVDSHHCDEFTQTPNVLLAVPRGDGSKHWRIAHQMEITTIDQMRKAFKIFAPLNIGQSPLILEKVSIKMNCALSNTI